MANYYKKYEPLFGSWYITEKIGEGAYGQVFVIERHELGVVYKSALKAITIPRDKNEIKIVMSDGMSEAEATEYYKKLVQDIVNEFIVMSKLKGNSHIVSYEDHLIIEHDEDIGWDILIRMELLTPLIEYTSDAQMEEREIVKLGIDLCKALEFCRKYDIIHRDIKPENIFIASSGDYKLGDFGISKTVDKTQLGLSRKVTYLYMAPEVYRVDAYGPTVDLYSLGLVMYKLLNNNRAPFMPEYPTPITYDNREEAVAKRVRGETVPNPQHGRSELRTIILKACAYNPEERYHSAREMRKALEKLFYQVYEEEKKPDSIIKRLDLQEIPPCDQSEGHLKKDERVNENKRRKKAGFLKKAALLAAATLLAVAGTAFALIPGEVEDIKGLEGEETIYIGDTLRPKYQVKPDRFADEKIKFEVADPSVISVDGQGNITGKKPGKSNLVLSVAGYEKKSLIRVVAKVTKISNVDDTIELTEGDREMISPKLSPKKFSDEPITYSVKDSTVAGVSKKGRITARAPGETTLTISAGGCIKSVNLIVYEYVPPDIYTEPATSAPTAPVYTPPSSSPPSSSGNSNENPSGDNSGESGNDYFDSGDDEYF